MYFYIVMELIYVVVFAIKNFKTTDTDKINKSIQPLYIIFLLFILKGIFYPQMSVDTSMVLTFLKTSVLICSFLFYATYYIIYLKDKDNIELAQKTLRLARINHFVCVVLLAGILYYEYSYAL